MAQLPTTLQPKTADVKPFLVGGRWRHGRGRTFDSINPAEGSVTAVVAESGPEDVDEAVHAAAAAMRNPAWRDLKAHQRGRLLYRLADYIEREADDLATLQTLDNGKPLTESRHQVAAAADTFRYYAALCETLESSVVPERGDYFAFTWHEPVGVVAAITPWNSPLTLEAQKLAPALAAGNAVVMKPSEVTPLIGLEYGRLALEAGFPAGVLNVLSGFGGTVGRPLVSHPLVDMVTFTGGTVSGREISKVAGERLIPAVVELGGKSPNVVFDDADLDEAVRGAVYAIFSNAGQSCIAGSRIFVHASIYDDFVSQFIVQTQALRVGNPFEPSTAIGPMASFQHRERVESYVTLGLKEGGELLTGGNRPTGAAFEKGAYFEPTVIALPNNSAQVAQEEIFGTVAVVLRFTDEDDLVAQANDTVFGLAAGIWTRDYKCALRVARRIRAGTIWINSYKQTAVNMPFGGFKQSGLWRECGVEGLRYYQETKSVYLSLANRATHWPPEQT